MTQGERVKAVRDEKRMTMEQFGERIGVQKSAISKIFLTEQQNPSVASSM